MKIRLSNGRPGGGFTHSNTSVLYQLIVHQSSIECWSTGIIATSGLLGCHGTQVLLAPPSRVRVKEDDKAAEHISRFRNLTGVMFLTWELRRCQMQMLLSNMHDQSEEHLSIHTNTHKFISVDLTCKYHLKAAYGHKVPTHVWASQAISQVSGCQLQVTWCFGSCYLTKIL